MVERDHRPQFGDTLPPSRRQRQRTPANPMFPDGEDLPIFSGTPIPATEQPFVPEDHRIKQAMLPEMPGIDNDAVLARDRKLRRPRGGQTAEGPQLALDAVEPGERMSEDPSDAEREAFDAVMDDAAADHLHQVLAAYHLDAATLRQMAIAGADLRDALTMGAAPEELIHLLAIYAHLFRPPAREQIKSPSDAAALLMVEMGYLDQEQMRVLCLDTKNRIQKIQLVYQGSLNTSMVRVGEIFKEPVRLNSAAVILAHNHPSGEPDPSPEDVMVTREIVQAGKLLDCEVLDHLVIGKGKWVSLREKGLGFDR